MKPDGYLGAKIDNEKYFIISKRTVIRLAREKEVIMKVLFHDQLLTKPKPMLKQIQLTFYILDPTSKFPALPGLLGTSSILLKNYNISVLIDLTVLAVQKNLIINLQCRSMNFLNYLQVLMPFTDIKVQ